MKNRQRIIRQTSESQAKPPAGKAQNLQGYLSRPKTVGHFEKGVAKNEFKNFSAPVVINATYAATNGINQLFGLEHLALTHEISEIAFVC